MRFFAVCKKRIKRRDFLCCFVVTQSLFHCLEQAKQDVLSFIKKCVKLGFGKCESERSCVCEEIDLYSCKSYFLIEKYFFLLLSFW